MLKGFKEFILRGNVVDLAVGVMIGAAFSAVVTALVTNVLTPLIGAIIKTPDFSELSFTINDSVFTYGLFLNALISFLLVAIAIYFFVIVPINALTAKNKNKTEDSANKNCPECLSEVPVKATRCAFCTTKIV